MSTKPTLQELAIAWLERNGQRNVERNTPPQQALQGERAFDSAVTPESLVPVEEPRGVPLFHPVRPGTAEHPSRTAADAEQWSEREVERLRDHYEERAAICENDDEAATADFEERAGIAENDGGLSRPRAEVLAALSVAPGEIDHDARAKVIDFAARYLERMRRT